LIWNVKPFLQARNVAMPKAVRSASVVDPQFIDIDVARGELYGYSLWKFGEDGWHLAKDCSLQGAVPSGPPRAPGLFAGQIRATGSVAA
jgi:hypothetical protein